MSPQNLKPTAARIIYLLDHCSTHSHLRQIQARLILSRLHINTAVAHRFITACHSLNLLDSNALPLYTTNLSRPHTFTCNTLLKLFSHSITPCNSLRLYSHMHTSGILVNNYTFPFVLKALAGLKLMKEGTVVHAQVIKFGILDDIYVGNSLMNLYAAVGEMGLCRKVFDEMPQIDVVSWTVMISGFREAGRLDDALITFERMKDESVMPNQVTVVNVLAACADFGALDMGVWLHELVNRCKWELDVILGTSLIDMYMKCGKINEGLCVFGQMSEKNVFTWNTVINGLALANYGKEAVTWFFRMEQEGLKPDDVTLIAVLCACVHSGFVHMGRKIFSSLVDGKYGFPPDVRHYACMVDVLARSGCLEEAHRMITEMPFEPTVSIWGALLSGCKAQTNMELSEIAAWKLVELEPENTAYYVVLSNLYAVLERWSDVEKVRNLMKVRGPTKCVGSSSVEHENKGNDLQWLA
ncbi:pentatricopeptide repeat-containing protein-like [Dorcoceras hygrometricum]|uniref:Pentatricopeptide repeat-containing protein-like n=1 Tax=Dorcoceras hygrometricum TaxID=472368 RepID=A0A2Z7BXD6_9LAMI|nr:pentatricopeptide repeat-containing protein-like [Dorcoceras hygrometricum]